MSTQYSRHEIWIRCVELVVFEVEARLPQYYNSTSTKSWYQVELATINEQQLKRVTLCAFHSSSAASKLIHIERDTTETLEWHLKFYESNTNKHVDCKIVLDEETMNEKDQLDWDNTMNSLVELLMPPKMTKTRAQTCRD